MGMVQPVSAGRCDGRRKPSEMDRSWVTAKHKLHARQVRQQSRKVIDQALMEVAMEEVWSADEQKAHMGRMAEKAAVEAQKIIDAAIEEFAKAKKAAYAIIDALPRDAQEELYERHLVSIPYLDY